MESHAKENGTLSAEDNAAYLKMEKEIEDLTAAIDRQRRAERMEQELSKPMNSPLTGKPRDSGTGNGKTGRASDEYKAAMLGAFRSNFRNVSNVLQEGVDADGGYLYVSAYNKKGIYKINLINSADVTLIDFGFTSKWKPLCETGSCEVYLTDLFYGRGRRSPCRDKGAACAGKVRRMHSL